MGGVIQIGASIGLPLLGLFILLCCLHKTIYVEKTVESKKLSREALWSRSSSFTMPSTNSPKGVLPRSSLMHYSEARHSAGG